MSTVRGRLAWAKESDLFEALNEDIKAHVEAECDVVIGTRDASNMPHVGRVWGPRLNLDDGTLELFVDLPKSTDVLLDVRDNARVAVTFVHPMTDRCIQLKGRCLEVGDAAADDWAWIERHRAGFAELVKHFGYAPHLVRNMWSMQVKKLRISVEAGFDQTPGPGAGKPL